MYITGILRSPWVGQKEVYEGMERVLNGAIDRLENLSKEMTEEKSKDNKSSYDVQPEEEIEFIDLDDVPEKNMGAEGKSR